MASRMMTVALRNTSKPTASLMSVRMSSSHHTLQSEQSTKIGNRDVVGFGFNGEPCYVDRVDYPMPSLRFKENTPDVLVR